jgi:hypothetical protein
MTPPKRSLKISARLWQEKHGLYRMKNKMKWMSMKGDRWQKKETVRLAKQGDW